MTGQGELAQLQPQDTFGRGLQDEHLATFAPPSPLPPQEQSTSQGQGASQVASSQARTGELPAADILPKQEVPTAELGGEAVVKKAVGVEAPLPGV